MKTTNKLNEFLYKQFTTNTGTHFLDSGGEDGRKWQQNQKKTLEDFLKKLEVELDSWYLERLKDDEEGTSEDLVPTVNTFHYMLNNLELDGTCQEFNSIPCEDWLGEGAYGLSQACAEYLERNGFRLGTPWNSYNYETNLDHVLQGCNVYTEEDAEEYPSYMLIQLHLGADVRGGYTDAKLYKLKNEYFNTNPNVYGSIDGIPVSTGYNGYNLTDEDGTNVPVKKDSKINLYVEEY